MAAGNSIGDLQNLINTFRQNGNIDGDELQDLYQTVHNVISGNNTSVLGLAYDAAVTYDTVATAETSGNPSYAEFGDRFWKSKTDNNLGNEPPSAAGTTENTNWIEVSKAEANAIKEWAPGLYGAGLIIVYHNDSLYKLDVAARPFESVDIDAEIADGKWIILGGGKFTELSDTPNSLSGLGGLAIKVKNDETGLEAGEVQGVPDGTFTIYSSADVTLNPTKAINNNYRLNRVGDGLLEFDLTNVEDGNSGTIVAYWTSLTAELLIEQNSIIKISSDSFIWFRGLLASRVSISNVDGTGTGGSVKITTSNPHNLTTGQIAFIQDVLGTEEANGANEVTVIDANNFELRDVGFYNAYTSGGESSLATKSLVLGYENNTYSLFSFIVQDGNVYLTGVNEFI